MKYLLPCSCGLSVDVEPRQAGQTVVCSCGKTLQVPSLSKVKELPVTTENKVPVHAAKKNAGLVRKAFFIIGFVLLVPGILFFTVTLLSPPKPQDVFNKRVYFSFGSNRKPMLQNSTPLNNEDIRVLSMSDDIIDRMMPIDLYVYFQSLRTPTLSYNFLDNYEAVKDTHKIWLIFGGIWLAVGIVCIILAFFMPKQSIEVTGWSGSDWR
ncbi:hypothetical protein FACS1894170_12200 [Planctomycetales bacterium]|nr:hypothetical protein FACS1894170_12200 [Planctomycetales bacterium]